VEDDGLESPLLEPLLDGEHARRRHAHHRQGNERALLGDAGRRRAGHPGDRAGSVREDRPRDPVQPRDVGDGRREDEVGRPDVVGCARPDHRRHEQLGHANRKRPHRLRDHRRAAAAGQAEDAVAATFEAQTGEDDRGAAGHGCQRDRTRVGALAGEAQLLQLCAAEARDLRGGDVRLERRLAEDADVDDDGLHSRLGEAVAHERELASFCVEGADEDDGGYARTGSDFSARTISVTARSTGSRSIDEAPR
jgi:hypothetical protein